MGLLTDLLGDGNAGGGGVLAAISHNPGTVATTSSSSTSFGDVDATNLAITFTAPASGQVLVRSCITAEVAGGTEMSLNLRDASGNVANTASNGVYSASSATTSRVVNTWLITGLTPSTSYTYKLGVARSFGSSTCNVKRGGTSGPATMEVLSA